MKKILSFLLFASSFTGMNAMNISLQKSIIGDSLGHFSPDGKMFTVQNDSNNNVQFFNTASYKTIMKPIHGYCAGFSTDGSLFVISTPCGEEPSMFQFYKTADHSQASAFIKGNFRGFHPNNSIFVVEKEINDELFFKFYDIKSHTEITHTWLPGSFQGFNSDGSKFVVNQIRGGDQYKIYDTSHPTPKDIMWSKGNLIFHPTIPWIKVVSHQNNTKVIDNEKIIASIKGVFQGYSPDGKLLITAVENNQDEDQLDIYSTVDYKLVGSIFNNDFIAFSPNNKTLVTETYDDNKTPLINFYTIS